MEVYFHLLPVILDIVCKSCLSHLYEEQVLFFHVQNLKMVSLELSFVLGNVPNFRPLRHLI